MDLLGLGSVLVGAFLWVATIKSFFDNPGYGAFDMTTASAFDLRWSKGALFLAVGVGMLAHSLIVGATVGVGGFLCSMLVKPVLQKIVAARIVRSSAPGNDAQPPSGFAALGQAERDATNQKPVDD